MKGYSIKFMAQHFKKSKETIQRTLNAAGYKYVFKEKQEHYYSIQSFTYLKNKYQPLVELIEIPVYKNVYWEIIHSKMNFE